MKTEQVIFIGEAPGKTAIPLGEEQTSLTEGAGRALAKLAGWEWRDYLHYTIRRNLFYIPVTDDTWSKPVARMSAALILGEFAGKGIPIICLGAKVREAMEPNTRTPLVKYGWVEVGDELDYEGLNGATKHYDFRTRVGYMPHPSGRNRVWNDPEEREAAYHYLHDLL